MNIENYTFLFFDILFGGSAVLIIWLRYRSFINMHLRFVAGFTLASVWFSYADYSAQKWHVWEFNKDRDLHISLLGTKIEAILLVLLIAAAVCMFTIAQADKIDKNAKERQKLKKTR